MNSKGFTLVELMGIITILVVLSLIIIPIIDKNIVDSKDSMYVVQIENIKIAGQNYFVDNITLRPNEGEYAFIDLEDLINYGYMSSFNGSKVGDTLVSDIYVQVLNDNGIYNYSVCPIDIDCVSSSDVS